MFPSKKGTVTFMKSQTIKTLGGVMSAVALISGGAGVAQAATVDSAAPAPAMPVVTAASDSAAPEAPGARTVEGSFSYDQDAVTANADISGVFCKAAATLCASLPTYGCEAAKAAAFELGVSRGIDPFMTLSFMALPVIPKLRITTRGVIDVETQQYV